MHREPGGGRGGGCGRGRNCGGSWWRLTSGPPKASLSTLLLTLLVVLIDVDGLIGHIAVAVVVYTCTLSPAATTQCSVGLFVPPPCHRHDHSHRRRSPCRRHCPPHSLAMLYLKTKSYCNRCLSGRSNNTALSTRTCARATVGPVGAGQHCQEMCPRGQNNHHRRPSSSPPP